MSEGASLEAVKREARELLKDYSRLWLTKPNRSLAGRSPHELAQSEAGARVVLAELRRSILAE